MNYKGEIEKIKIKKKLYYDLGSCHRLLRVC